MEIENTQSFTTPPIQPEPKRDLPNAVAILVCGILSIPTCMCYGVIAIALGIVSIILGSKALKLYRDNPELYTESSFKNAKAGRICGIIGLSLGAVYLIFVIIMLIFVGTSGVMMDQIMRNSGY